MNVGECGLQVISYLQIRKKYCKENEEKGKFR